MADELKVNRHLEELKMKTLHWFSHVKSIINVSPNKLYIKYLWKYKSRTENQNNNYN